MLFSNASQVTPVYYLVTVRTPVGLVRTVRPSSNPFVRGSEVSVLSVNPKAGIEVGYVTKGELYSWFNL